MTQNDFPEEAAGFWEKTSDAAAGIASTFAVEAPTDPAPDCPCECPGCHEAEHCGGPNCEIEEV